MKNILWASDIAFLWAFNAVLWFSLACSRGVLFLGVAISRGVDMLPRINFQF